MKKLKCNRLKDSEFNKKQKILLIKNLLKKKKKQLLSMTIKIIPELITPWLQLERAPKIQGLVAIIPSLPV